MLRNPYRRKKSRRLMNGFALIGVTLFFVGTNMFLVNFLPPFDTSHRSMSDIDEHLKDGKYYDAKNKDILHVVTSRFMQDQPQLIALGKARLRLFETFCLPTMLNQKVDNFIWFVMTDPELDRDLLSDLQSLLQPHPNFYLVASNAKLLTPTNITSMVPLAKNKKDYAASDDTAVVESKVVLTGNIEMLHSRMLDPNRTLLIETRLDADDGLHFDSLSDIQETARALPVDKRGWQIICSNLHYEWRNNEVTLVSANKTKIESPGVLRVVKESICVTPGYTLVRHREAPSFEFPEWPPMGHNVVTRDWPECKLVESEATAGVSNNGNATYDCWKRLGYYPSAIRSRTITSAGMSRVDTIPGAKSKFENRSILFWKLVQRDFNIEPERAIFTSQYIHDNLESVVLDNLKGQCTFGHSCKNSSKIKLEQLLAKHNQSKIDWNVDPQSA